MPEPGATRSGCPCSWTTWKGSARRSSATPTRTTRCGATWKHSHDAVGGTVAGGRGLGRGAGGVDGGALDAGAGTGGARRRRQPRGRLLVRQVAARRRLCGPGGDVLLAAAAAALAVGPAAAPVAARLRHRGARSEERRVGNEC